MSAALIRGATGPLAVVEMRAIRDRGSSAVSHGLQALTGELVKGRKVSRGAG